MIAQTILEVLKDEMGLSGEIPLDQDLYSDLGVSSVDSIKLLLALENKFGIALDDQEFAQSRTVNKLAELIASSTKGEATNADDFCPAR